MSLYLLCALLCSSGVYFLLKRSWMNLVFGLALLGHAANLFIFAMGGLHLGAASFVDKNLGRVISPAADPVPQAHILTANVNGFGMQAFLLVLFSLASKDRGVDTNELPE